MNKHVAAAAILALMLSPWTARASDRIVALNVDNATCELRGPIVKKTLARVWGVKAVQGHRSKGRDGSGSDCLV
jgi:mercuric ion binding protein